MRKLIKKFNILFMIILSTTATSTLCRSTFAMNDFYNPTLNSFINHMDDMKLNSANITEFSNNKGNDDNLNMADFTDSSYKIDDNLPTNVFDTTNYTHTKSPFDNIIAVERNINKNDYNSYKKTPIEYNDFVKFKNYINTINDVNELINKIDLTDEKNNKFLKDMIVMYNIDTLHLHDPQLKQLNKINPTLFNNYRTNTEKLKKFFSLDEFDAYREKVKQYFTPEELLAYANLKNDPRLSKQEKDLIENLEKFFNKESLFKYSKTPQQNKQQQLQQFVETLLNKNFLIYNHPETLNKLAQNLSTKELYEYRRLKNNPDLSAPDRLLIETLGKLFNTDDLIKIHNQQKLQQLEEKINLFTNKIEKNVNRIKDLFTPEELFNYNLLKNNTELYLQNKDIINKLENTFNNIGLSDYVKSFQQPTLSTTIFIEKAKKFLDESQFSLFNVTKNIDELNKFFTPEDLSEYNLLKNDTELCSQNKDIINKLENTFNNIGLSDHVNSFQPPKRTVITKIKQFFNTNTLFHSEQTNFNEYFAQNKELLSSLLKFSLLENDYTLRLYNKTIIDNLKKLFGATIYDNISTMSRTALINKLQLFLKNNELPNQDNCNLIEYLDMALDYKDKIKDKSSETYKAYRNCANNFFTLFNQNRTTQNNSRELAYYVNLSQIKGIVDNTLNAVNKILNRPDLNLEQCALEKYNNIFQIIINTLQQDGRLKNLIKETKFLTSQLNNINTTAFMELTTKINELLFKATTMSSNKPSKKTKLDQQIQNTKKIFNNCLSTLEQIRNDIQLTLNSEYKMDIEKDF